MFSGLRGRLTALYLLAAVALTAAVSAGAYLLLWRYFTTTTDQALERKIALALNSLRVSQPGDHTGGEGEDDSHRPSTGLPLDTELAPISLAALDSSGSPLAVAGTDTGTLTDAGGARQAAHAGSDWRIVTASTGQRVRVYSLRVDQIPGLVLQASRSLADQDRTLTQLLWGLLAIGGGMTVLLGAGSWWLAGRSLAPAQQAWERQQMFVANASHELRTPLTLLRASAEVARRGLKPGEAEQRELLDDVLTECDHMAGLVNDLLLLSRLDAGRLALEIAPVELAPLLDDVVRQVGRIAAEREVTLEVARAAGTAQADPARVRQILLIALDNALRHTPAGGAITLSAEPRGKQVELVVADTGPGIPPEHLPRLFERFYRVDSARGRAAGGSGLGLAIAHSLVEAQHGHIRLDSALGRGTRVSVTLPRAA